MLIDNSSKLKISRADFNTILLHAEKISNGQLDFVNVLRGELKNLLNIDNPDPLIDSIKTAGTDLINQTKLFLAQFDFIIEDTDAYYHLVKISDTYCELEPVEIPTTDSEIKNAIVPADGANLPTTTPTLAQRVVKIQFHLQNMGQSAIIIGQELIECKKEVPHGEWAIWLENNFKLKKSSAANFMAISERFSNFQTFGNLGYSQMVQMLALPAGEEENFIEQKAAEGTPVENMTVKQLRADVKKWKNESEKLQKELAETDKLQRHYQSLYSAEFEHARENACKVTDLQMEKSKLQAEITNLKNQPPQVIERTETIIPPDYVATKQANAELQELVDELEEKDEENQKIIENLQNQVSDALSKQAVTEIHEVEVSPPDYEDTKKELEQLKIQQDNIRVDIAISQNLQNLCSAANFLLEHQDRLTANLQNFLSADSLTTENIKQLAQLVTFLVNNVDCDFDI